VSVETSEVNAIQHTTPFSGNEMIMLTTSFVQASAIQ